MNSKIEIFDNKFNTPNAGMTQNVIGIISLRCYHFNRINRILTPTRIGPMYVDRIPFQCFIYQKRVWNDLRNTMN